MPEEDVRTPRSDRTPDQDGRITVTAIRDRTYEGVTKVTTTSTGELWLIGERGSEDIKLIAVYPPGAWRLAFRPDSVVND
jgi:hypothetical protein